MKTFLLTACVLLLALSSCRSSKNIVYLQDVDLFQQNEIIKDYEAKIQKNDLLSIVVSSQNPELAQPFNMPLASYQAGTMGMGGYQQRLLGYYVDVDGNIDFPILGTLHIEGLTRKELVALIKDRLISEDLIKDPVVTIEFQNFKVAVLGEVNRPGSFSITGDRVTLMDALSLAGDLTIYGKRDRIAVIRETAGHRTIHYHDLRSTSIFESPYYYLQQNHIVYVEPNKYKAGQSMINQNNSVGVWVSGLSLLTSVSVLIYNILYDYYNK